MRSTVKEFVPDEPATLTSDFQTGVFVSKQLNSARLVSPSEFSFNMGKANQEVYSNSNNLSHIYGPNKQLEDPSNLRDLGKTETQKKFKTMRKTEICTKWEAGFCKWGD